MSTVEQFLTQLQQSGLSSEADRHALEEGHATEPKDQDAQGLAKRLVREGKLTALQAGYLYRGKGKALVLGNYIVLEKIGQGGMGVVRE